MNGKRYTLQQFMERVEDPEHNLAAVERLGMPRERWFHYQEQLHALELSGGVLKGDGGNVEFRADPGSVSNGDLYKGYMYTLTPSKHVKANLDGYRIADGNKDGCGGWLVCRPLKGHWYLYLFVNG